MLANSFFTPDTVREELFYPQIDKLENGIIVEIGILVCGNLCKIAQYAKNKQKNIKFYGIDNFSFIFNEEDSKKTYHGDINGEFRVESFQRCINNLLEVDVLDYVKLISGNSTDYNACFPNESIDMIFLDTTHTYEHVKNEIICWKNQVKTGGIISGHDWNFEGVSDAVIEMFPDNEIHIVADGTTFWLQK